MADVFTAEYVTYDSNYSNTSSGYEFVLDTSPPLPVVRYCVNCGHVEGEHTLDGNYCLADVDGGEDGRIDCFFCKGWYPEDGNSQQRFAWVSEEDYEITNDPNGIPVGGGSAPIGL